MGFAFILHGPQGAELPLRYDVGLKYFREIYKNTKRGGKRKEIFKKRAVLRSRTPAFALPDCWWLQQSRSFKRPQTRLGAPRGRGRSPARAFPAHSVPYSITAGFLRRRLRFLTSCASWGGQRWGLRGEKQSPFCRSLAGNETRQFLAAKPHGRLCSVALGS